MVHKAVLALGLVSASSFKIVSQTFNGNLTMTYSTPGVPTPTMATVELGLDMEAAKLRMNEHIEIEMHTPYINMTSTTKVSMIFDASTKRVTRYTNMEFKSSTPIPAKPPTCEYFEFPSMPAPAAVAKCLQDLAALAKPVDSEDDLLKFTMHMPVPKAQGTADEVICTDKAFVMKKLTADVTVTGAHPMTIHEEMIDMNSKAGAPDSSVFVVPAVWGTCVSTPTPPMPTTNNPATKAFLHCMGMASQASVMVKSNLTKAAAEDSTCAKKGHCGLAYQGCCAGFAAKGFPCGCHLKDGAGATGADCGTCGTAYSVCCAGYKLKGFPCTCDISSDGDSMLV